MRGVFTWLTTVLFFITAIFLWLGKGLAQPIGFMSPQSVQESRFQCLSSPHGRFVFGQISDSPKDQYMLDTWTGRLWRIAERGGVGKYLERVPYKLKSGKYASLPEDVPLTKGCPSRCKNKDLTR